MPEHTHLICYEIASRIETDNPETFTVHLSPMVDFKFDQDAPNLLYVYRRLVFKEGTQDEVKMRKKERLYLERIIKTHHLSAKIISIEVMPEPTILFPTKYLLAYNPVCFSAYFEDEGRVDD